MNRRTVSTFIATCLIVGLAGFGQTATITIVNRDGANEGFNDPTPVAPVGGNPGTTLGEQRLYLFETAARIWGSWIGSDAEIFVNAAFDPHPNGCGVLGWTSPNGFIKDHPSFPHQGTWYYQALANALAGTDLMPGLADMNTTYNSLIDTAQCPGGFYYGVDGNAGGLTNLLPVLLHEIAHGLGFSGRTSLVDGSYLGGFPDQFSWNVYDNEVQMFWNDMTAGQRFASLQRPRKVVWTGPSAAAGMPEDLLRPWDMEVDVSAPAPAAGVYAGRAALFGGVPPMEFPGEIELVSDGTALPSEGCSPLVGFTPGRIALIDRGTCEFGQKALNAEDAGASAVIVANYDPSQTGGGDELVNMGAGTVGDQVTIPALFIGYTAGQTIQSNLPGVQTTNRIFDRQNADADGRPMLFTPATVVGGSSVNHWETTSYDWDHSDLLMEPNISLSLHTDLDITPGQLEDVGHRLIYVFADGFEAGDTAAWTAVVP
jgi:hypothetical protein